MKISRKFIINSKKDYSKIKEEINKEIENIEQRNFFSMNSEEIKEYSIKGIAIASIISIIDKFWDKLFEEFKSQKVDITKILKNEEIQRLITISVYAIIFTILVLFIKIKMLDKILERSEKNKLKRMEKCLDHLEEIHLNEISKNRKIIDKLKEISNEKYNNDNISNCLLENEKNELNIL